MPLGNQRHKWSVHQQARKREKEMVTIEEFLECYARLEKTVALAFPRDKNKQHIVKCLMDNHVVGIGWPRLQKLRTIRNVFSHNPRKEGEDIYAFNNSALTFLNKAIGIVQTLPRVGNVCKSLKRVYSCRLDTIISDVVAEMMKRVYSHVPVLDDLGKVIGVFSESTMLQMHRNGWIHKNIAQMKSIRDLLPIERHKADEFPFVATSEPVPYLRRLTDDALVDGKRIGMFLVTENGCAEEPLIGILTVWDLVGVSDGNVGNK